MDVETLEKANRIMYEIKLRKAEQAIIGRGGMEGFGTKLTFNIDNIRTPAEYPSPYFPNQGGIAVGQSLNINVQTKLINDFCRNVYDAIQVQIDELENQLEKL